MRQFVVGVVTLVGVVAEQSSESGVGSSLDEARLTAVRLGNRLFSQGKTAFLEQANLLCSFDLLALVFEFVYHLLITIVKALKWQFDCLILVEFGMNGRDLAFKQPEIPLRHI